ncbi:NADPH-dependent assimilatory sulfite reductase hemoprotein subunit [Flavihumibacter rivuli]|uniref:NADPH-dependent assimilatory sulfite reductase hemoprotein subunit n=1 Tax=Flavihumibacter rivuli TaxID=2838156 RepID=UPI001BDED816|nr:NADPH-dependent assimilatory sulfite reductase hemoprotein subunit [Flavihumibacter rivuli]ULQ57460.1 NADPH-dependent assimilatory sulfite reductase hemoprotein subunit [Flavihumibacter rivuli]
MSLNQDKSKLSEVEHIKEASNYLEGTLPDSLKDELTGNLFAQDQQLIKFHGSYVQSDRELEKERKAQKLEPLYSFMIRVRVPGGIATPQQWVALDDLANKYGNPTLKLTTRQAFELHGILKHNLKPTIREINETLLSTIAACGDVNRNVMNTVNPYTSAIHDDVQAVAQAISDHLNPRTTAYYKIWLNDEEVGGSGVQEEEIDEPIYGKTYLPRKFKITLAIPPYNDTDVFAHDIGLIAIEDNGKLAGFNFSVGGGMGMTFGDEGTYPRLGNVIGYAPVDKAVDVCEKIVTIQRDYGNRENRRYSRFKYTVDRMGLEFIKTELNKRLGYDLEPAKPFKFTTNGDSYGWVKGVSGKWFNTLYIEHGRVRDFEDYPLKKGLRAIAEVLDGDFRLTGNQNVVIGNVSEEQKPQIEALLQQYGIAQHQEVTNLHQHSLACVALNLCPLANAEGERYLPTLVSKIHALLSAHGIGEQAITIRMTGCPNGCGRPYLGEIGFVGRAPGKYNLYLGASFNGDRLNVLYREALTEEEILATLDPIIGQYAKEKAEGEHFGDFLLRKGIVNPHYNKSDFHSS